MIDLVFPPVASPTCVPLGVSFLKAHIKSACGPDRLRVLDLNIRYWNRLAAQNGSFADYQRFVRGETGRFSREFYEPLLPVQQALKEETVRHLSAVRLWLDTGNLPEELDTLFRFLAESLADEKQPVLFSCLFPDQLLFALGFTRWLRRERNASIYLGGASVLVTDPADLLKAAPWLEGIFTGEGELALEIFLRQGEEVPVPGLYRRRNGKILRELPPNIPFREALVVPDFSWAALEDYHNPVKVLPVQFSRGCKWRRCRFCAHNMSFGKYRCLDPVAAVDMLAGYRTAYGADHFYVTDQYLDASFLEPFAREILARKLRIRYNFMGRPAEDMTAEVMALLARSGCRWISWGVESGNARLLNLADKGTSPDTVSAVLQNSARAGIRNQALMIFGLPGSDDTAAEDTFSFLQDNRTWIHSHTASEFQLYRGTPFGARPERYGLKVTGPAVFCRIDGRPLESMKREYLNQAVGEEPDMLRGPLESRRWKRRHIWIYPDTFWNALPSEHYLILSAMEIDRERPDNPVRKWAG